MSSAGSFITDVLGIKIYPALSGGKVLTVFDDKVADDRGPGTYTYPQAEVYSPYRDHLDLIKYIVKKPVHNKGMTEYRHFWAFDVVMGSLANPLNAPAGFSFPVINIYISIENAKGGRTDTFAPARM